MKSPLKTLSRETAIYGISTVIGRFLNFLLVPFYVNVLRTRTEFGISSSLYAYIAFLSVVFPLGLEGAYFRYAARAEGDAGEIERERRLFSTPFWLIAGFSLVVAVLIIVFASQLAGPAFADPSHDLTPMMPMLTEILRLGALILFFDALSVIPFASLRLEHRAGTFATIKVANILLTLFLNFIFVLRWRWGVPGIFRANAIASCLTLIAVLFCCGSRLRPRFDFSAVRKMVPFGLGNVPAYLGAMVVQVIDRPIVQYKLGLDQLAVYQANYRMGFAMMVFVSIFDYAWRPFFLRQYATQGDDSKPLFARVFSYTTLFSMMAFLALSFFLPWFVGVPLPFVHHSLLKKNYLSGTDVIPVVLLAYVFQGFYTNFIVGIYIREKTRWLPVVTGIGALVNVMAIFVFIGRWGILGAAYATLLAYIVMALGLYLFARHFFPIRYEWGRIAKIFVIVLAAYFLGKFLGSGVWQAVLVLAALAALLVAGVFRVPELTSVRDLFRSRPAQFPSDPVGYASGKEEHD